MGKMWSCYHCKKEIAPRAPACPHCGGTFNASSRGFMSGESGNPGCAILIAAFVGVGAFLANAPWVEASEWQIVPKTASAFVENSRYKMKVTCNKGSDGLFEPAIIVSLHTMRGNPVSFTNSVQMEVSTKGSLTGLENSEFGAGKFLSFNRDRIVPQLRSGDEVTIRQREPQRAYVFSLAGSAKALDACFAGPGATPAQTTPIAQTAGPDIVGLKTGMSFHDMRTKVTAHLGKDIRADIRDTRVTHFGSGPATNASVSFDAWIAWRKFTPSLREFFSVSFAPKELGQKALIISRDLFYETSGPNANPPLLSTVIEEGLKPKYGQPSAWLNRKDGLGGKIIWIFDPDTGESFGNHYPHECTDLFEIKQVKWGYVGSANDMARMRQTFKTDPNKCGIILRAKYQNTGAVLRSLTTTMYDLPLIYQSYSELHDLLRRQTKQKEQQVKATAKGVKPKF